METKSKKKLTEIPKFGISSFCCIFGNSCSGKSTYVKNLLKEHQYHFTNLIHRIIFIHSVEDNCVKELKEVFPDKKGEKPDGKYFKNFPADLMNYIIPGHTIIVIDDKEDEIGKNKEIAKDLNYIATVLCHHESLNIFINFQTFMPLYKKHALHCTISQSTNLVFFRNSSNSVCLKRFMANYSIRLKKGQTLYDVFKRFIQKERFSYLMIDVSPTAKCATAYSNMLLCDKKPMLSFHDSDDYDTDAEN